ncbi:MAG: aminotransferase class I/II-fold pyridoxal phosphate-dependent enzyme [Polaromonas sp.]|nr:aminotransferase class I/II-fold pyridoxal phosphate-dependent enzyme [Polaromonas sp.]
MLANEASNDSGPKVNLSSNESALGPSPKATQAAGAALGSIERYPEDGPQRLATAIGAAFGLDPARIVCGHGSDELLQRLARAYLNPGDEVIHSVHGYLKFPNYAFSMSAVPVAAPDQDFRASVDGMLSCLSARTRMVLLANPDNPTGTCLGGAEIRRLHAGLPGNVLLVLDSAYAEYVSDEAFELPVDLVNEAQNVVMTRTFSKIFGMAGMRLGWLYGPSAVVDVLQRLSMTFPISAPAVAAGVAAVTDQHHMTYVRGYNRDQRAEFCSNLKAMGLHVFPSETNFVLIDFKGQQKTARAAYDHLYLNGIVGRMFGAPDYRNMLRLTIGLETEMRQTARVLGDFMAI